MGSDDPRVFTAGEVQDVSGLSSRQLNDWDSRGALPHDRETKSSWRRFSPREVFAITVCAEFRKRFGIPIERLKYVHQSMLQDGANHLEAAADLMARLGMGVWLMTDFESEFIMDSELEFQDLWSWGYFGGDSSKAHAAIKVNPLVNLILSKLGDSLHLPAHGRGYEAMHAQTARFGEFALLQLIRSGDFEKVEVTTGDGKVKTIRSTRRVDPRVSLDDILRQGDFQSVRVVQKDGKVVSIIQEETIKP
jgi:DNA-binding transcriptional MerR regulator